MKTADCIRTLTFHTSHVSAPGPVLSRCHGGDVVFWVRVHGLTHEGAVHVDRVIAATTISGDDTEISSSVG